MTTSVQTQSTLQYVRQFSPKKKSNLKPSLSRKYHVGQQVIVTLTRDVGYGYMAITDDGLYGLLHNQEMSLEARFGSYSLYQAGTPITVTIREYDRRTGKVAFTMKVNKLDFPSCEITTLHPTTKQYTRPAQVNSNVMNEQLPKEVDDIQQFLEKVIQSPLSPTAKETLVLLLNNNSVPRFTYYMQEIVDVFEPDSGVQLISMIALTLNSQTPHAGRC